MVDQPSELAGACRVRIHLSREFDVLNERVPFSEVDGVSGKVSRVDLGRFNLTLPRIRLLVEDHCGMISWEKRYLFIRGREYRPLIAVNTSHP